MRRGDRTGRRKGPLERLERANLFLVPLDDRRHWYRYHHLFADVLRAHLQDEQAEQVPDLHARASDWYGHKANAPRRSAMPSLVRTSPEQRSSSNLAA